ncbi:MAG: hypothetical protein R2941_14625 [Desulfobacterales bacterium]
MIMFWGFPTRLAALPIFAEVASAMRKGPKGSPYVRQMLTTTGVMKMQMVSFIMDAK